MSLFVVCIHDESVYVCHSSLYAQSRARVCHSSLYANMPSPCMSFFAICKHDELMSIFAVGIHDEPLYVILRCMHI